MSIKEKIIEIKNSMIDAIINRMEKEPGETMNGYIDLSKLSLEEREKAFINFSEGNDDLYTLLSTAYENGIESMFSCCGHGENEFGYVIFKVNDENLEKIQQLGKALSHEGVVTNFEDHYKFGKRVSFHSIRAQDRSWFAKVAETIKNLPEHDIEPTIIYHEYMYKTEQPLSERMKEGVIKTLRGLLSPKRISAVNTEESERKEKFGEKIRKEYPIDEGNIIVNPECIGSEINEASIEDGDR